MAPLNLKALVGKLNATCRRTLEAAAGLCLSRTNYNVELEHWLLKLLEPSDTDLPRVLQHYEIDKAKVSRELTRSLDQLKTGNARAPELSADLLDLMREAWVLASLEYQASRIRSGYLLAALLADRTHPCASCKSTRSLGSPSSGYGFATTSMLSAAILASNPPTRITSPGTTLRRNALARLTPLTN